jgi:hypothetical protein
MAFNQVDPLSSLAIGSWMELLAWGLVAMSCVCLAITVYYVTDPLSAGRWSAAEAVSGVASLALLALAIPSFLVWVYRLHRDLGRLGSYPLSPRQALVRIVIPIYNVWGIWVVFRTLADALRATHGGDRARGITFWLGVCLFAGAVGRATNRMLERTQLESGDFPFVLALGSVFVESVAVLAMALVVRFSRAAPVLLLDLAHSVPQQRGSGLHVATIALVALLAVPTGWAVMRGAPLVVLDGSRLPAAVLEHIDSLDVLEPVESIAYYRANSFDHRSGSVFLTDRVLVYEAEGRAIPIALANVEDIDVEWAQTFYNDTEVTVEVRETWITFTLPVEYGGHRRFVDRLQRAWSGQRRE